MTIQELADRAEVTTRTIRYYVEQGVLPPPERGRPAEYTEEHVERLALIKRLKEQYLPLEEIRDTLQHLSLAEVEQLVEQYSPSSQEVAERQKPELGSRLHLWSAWQGSGARAVEAPGPTGRRLCARPGPTARRTGTRTAGASNRRTCCHVYTFACAHAGT